MLSLVWTFFGPFGPSQSDSRYPGSGLAHYVITCLPRGPDPQPPRRTGIDETYGARGDTSPNSASQPYFPRYFAQRRGLQPVPKLKRRTIADNLTACWSVISIEKSNLPSDNDALFPEMRNEERRRRWNDRINERRGGARRDAGASPGVNCRRIEKKDERDRE